MSLKNSPSNRVTNNPYLVEAVPQSTPKLTVWSELKRLLSSPWRFLATLVLVLAPGLLAVSGGLDLLSTWLYTVSHHAQSDPRPTVNLLECMQDQTKELCKGVVWASPANPRRMTLYLWHDFDLINRYEPWLFIGFFAVAVLSFAAIGSPNAVRIGQTFKEAFGLKGGKGARGKDKLFDLSPEPGNGPVPRALLDLEQPGNFWNEHLLVGEFVPRHWETNPGYFWLEAEAKPVPYWLNLNILRTGLVIVAPPGSGKTASIFKPLRTFVDRSRSMGIFFDVKSSENANGTGTDFPPDLFDLNFDAALSSSIKLNLFAGQTPAQAGERLAEALIPDLGGDKAYFSNNAKSAMATIVASFHAIFKSYPTLVQILNYLSNPENLENLHKRLLNRAGGAQTESADFLRLPTLLQRVINLSHNKTTDTLGNLATALEPLVTDVAARLLVTNPEPGAFTIEQLLKEPRLVRLALPVANNPRIYPIIGRLVLAQFTYSVLSPECNRQLFKLIAVDEARFFITDNVANGMAQARSSNAGYALSFQTLTQIRDEALLDNIFANAGSKLVMGKVGDKDAERFSRLFGTIELPYLSHSSGTNQGTNKSNGHSYSRGSEFEFMSSGLSGYESRATRATSNGRSTSAGFSQGTNMSTRARRRFMDSEVRELEQRHAIIESSDDHGRQWFAQVINMDARRVKELELEVSKEIVRLVRKGFKGKIHLKPLALNIALLSQPELEKQPVKSLEGIKTQILTTPNKATVTRRLPKPTPIAVEGEIIMASESDTETQDENDQETTRALLRSIGLPENEVNELAQIIADTNHTDADLIRLIEVFKTRDPDNLADLVASMIRINRYPGQSQNQGQSRKSGQP